jgi:hypothetical protein
MLLTPSVFVFAQQPYNQTDWNTFTITTYYPAPYGVYRNMRLYPSDQPTAGVEPGVMYYNKTENVIKFLSNTTWVNMTAGNASQNQNSGIFHFTPQARPATATAGDAYYDNGSGGKEKGLYIYNGTLWKASSPSAEGMLPLFNNAHTIQQCLDNDGSTQAIPGSTFKFCRLPWADCTSHGWSQYSYWSRTVDATIWYCCWNTCTSGHHDWGNRTSAAAMTDTTCCGPSLDPSCVGSTIVEIGCY